MTGLWVDDVTVRYGPATALDRFSLEVASGEIVAVVGPSGSGKSTLLRAVAGLEPLAGGRIELDGRDLAGVPTHRRALGMMFQDHGLFTHLSVADNIAYGLRIAGVSARDRRSRVSELLELVGLTGFGSRRTSELSGGEAQRVALARALAPEPGLLMLDEPLGSLDRALRDQLTGELRRLLTELGQTALHVTHDQSEAFALADRVVVVADGRPVAVGTPSQLWADPATRFVAEFLGHPNIWTVDVADDGAVSWLDQPLGRLAADHPLRRGGAGVKLAVMPTTGIAVVADRHETAVGTLDVEVRESVFRRGVHDVAASIRPAGEARSTNSARYPASGRPTDGAAGIDGLLRFTTGGRPELGRPLRVAIDPEALRPLTEDGSPPTAEHDLGGGSGVS